MNVNEGTDSDSVISPITNASSPTPGNADHQAGVAAVTAVEEVLSSPTTEQLNMRCTGVKRLLKEALELREPNELFCARPLEDNLFEWHFTVRGPPDTVYADGVYHGRIVLPTEYPMKPPNLILLTPNGRFETNKKICLSISGYHPETWLPSWSIRTALLALIGFMPTHSAGALGGLECSQEERRRLALKSLKWHCPQCNICMQDALTPLGTSGSTEQLMAEVKSASTPPAPLVQNLAKKKMTESGGNGMVQQQQTDSSAPAGSTSQQNTTASSAFPTSSSIMDVPSPVPPPSTRPTTGQTRNGPTRARSAFLESPLLWIFVLFVLFLALLFRRLLLNYPHILQPHQGQDHRGL